MLELREDDGDVVGEALCVESALFLLGAGELVWEGAVDDMMFDDFLPMRRCNVIVFR